MKENEWWRRKAGERKEKNANVSEAAVLSALSTPGAEVGRGKRELC